jgi:hypothetical protein
VILRGMARRVPAGRNLRHVYDRRHARFSRGLREIGRGAENSRRDRMKEIGRADALHGSTNVINVSEIADGDINPAPPQLGSPVVLRAHISLHALAHLEQFVDSGAPRTPGRTADQNACLAHRLLPFEGICSHVGRGVVAALASRITSATF